MKNWTAWMLRTDERYSIIEQKVGGAKKKVGTF